MDFNDQTLLSTEFPNWLSKLRFLKFLTCENCRFTGVPGEWTGNLDIFHFGGNRLSGELSKAVWKKHCVESMLDERRVFAQQPGYVLIKSDWAGEEDGNRTSEGLVYTEERIYKSKSEPLKAKAKVKPENSNGWRISVE